MPLLQPPGQPRQRRRSYPSGHAVRTLAHRRLPVVLALLAAALLSRGRGYTLFLTPNEAILALIKAPGDGTVLRMTLVGAQPSPRVVGLDELPGKVNYFIGNDPADRKSTRLNS